MAKPDTFKQNMMLADVDPSLLLEGGTPRLICVDKKRKRKVITKE